MSSYGQSARTCGAWLSVLGAIALSIIAAHAAADARQPIVVELFQSQGCSSCPPAILNVNALADRTDVLALDFAVTYWDNLGWKDTFASPQFTARQWDYARGVLRAKNVYTPQVVIDGRNALVGTDAAELERAIARTPVAPPAAALSLSGLSLAVGEGNAPDDGADVWLVRYDPHTLQVDIIRGENGGRTLAHRNIVKELTRLGDWTGAATRFTLPPGSDSGLQIAILVQGKHGGPILAALKA